MVTNVGICIDHNRSKTLIELSLISAKSRIKKFKNNYFFFFILALEKGAYRGAPFLIHTYNF